MGIIQSSKQLPSTLGNLSMSPMGNEQQSTNLLRVHRIRPRAKLVSDVHDRLNFTS